ncbi:MAG: biotin--[acetyl-CoA-carboxylase] ligase [Lutibacter sp.]|uniref:biotin--[acetyl-CoA-carboxylase] ligase n=1 Tax=Lutibacter sp. TaxID=1925666 RepID=UPI00385AE5F3
MNIIKLNAIDSTNSYLKRLANKTTIDSYTVVVAKHQTEGRGQLGSKWVSDGGKNLTFSVLVNFNNFKIEHQFYLSMAVSLGVLDAVNNAIKIQCFVKWPNDILAGKDKVAGILIENVLRGEAIKYSIIGVGLNVNQKKFPKSIGNVTSLNNISDTNFNIDELLKNIITNIQFYIDDIERAEFKKIKQLYIASLYKYNKPVMFEDYEHAIFLGKIIDISEEGKLIIELENEKTRKFSLKEIKFASRIK